MRRLIHVIVVAMLALAGLPAARGTGAEVEAGKESSRTISVAVVTGGHEFNEREFLKLFEGHKDVTFKPLPQKTGGELFENVADWPYRVIVLYNFNQQITPKQQANFAKLLDKGVGLVILHHASAAYPDWPLFRKIAGVEYHLGPWQKNGTPMPPSGYKHGVKFRVHVADRKHPITRGLADYDLEDETYCRTSVDPGVHVLLTTDEPTSDKVIGWTRSYGKARVCYLQSGHDETAYRNANYRTLVIRAIRWTAGKR